MFVFVDVDGTLYQEKGKPNHWIVEFKFSRVTIILHLESDLLKQFSYRATCLHCTLTCCTGGSSLPCACLEILSIRSTRIACDYYCIDTQANSFYAYPV